MDASFVRGVLLRCFVYSFGLLLIWFGMFVVIGDWAYAVHSKMFDITRHDFELMNYGGMVLVKLILFVGFLIPYLAVRFAAGKQRSGAAP